MRIRESCRITTERHPRSRTATQVANRGPDWTGLRANRTSLTRSLDGALGAGDDNELIGFGDESKLMFAARQGIIDSRRNSGTQREETKRGVRGKGTAGGEMEINSDDNDAGTVRPSPDVATHPLRDGCG